MSMKRNEFQPTRPVPLNAHNMYFQQNSFGQSPVGSFSFTNPQQIYSPAFIITPMDTPMIEDYSDEMKDDNSNFDQEMFVFDEQMERQNQLKSMNNFNNNNNLNNNNYNNNSHCNNHCNNTNGFCHHSQMNGNGFQSQYNQSMNCHCNSFHSNGYCQNSQMNGLNSNTSTNFSHNPSSSSYTNNYTNIYPNNFNNNNYNNNFNKQSNGMNGYKSQSIISTHSINKTQLFNQPSNSPMIHGNIVQNNTQYDPNRFNRGGNTNYFTNIPTPQYNQFQQFQRSMSSQIQNSSLSSQDSHMNISSGYSYCNTNDLAFHSLSDHQKQIQTSSMPRNGIANISNISNIQNVRETPISVRDFGVDDDEFDHYGESEEFDEFDDDYESEDDYENENDEIFQEVIETVHELKKIGDQNNQLLSNMIKSQK